MGKMILNAAELITCKGGSKAGIAMRDIGIITDGAMVMKDGIITDIGTTDEILARHKQADYQVIDAADKCVFPAHRTWKYYRVAAVYSALWRRRGRPILSA